MDEANMSVNISAPHSPNLAPNLQFENSAAAMAS